MLTVSLPYSESSLHGASPDSHLLVLNSPACLLSFLFLGSNTDKSVVTLYLVKSHRAHLRANLLQLLHRCLHSGGKK